MKHILIVDDNPRALEDLRRSLRAMSSDWQVAFASGGKEAVQMLGTRAFDVVVTDLRMPGLDGSDVLKAVQEKQPDAVRIVASEPGEQLAAMRAIPFAHQFLSKPLAVALVWQAVERSSTLKQLLANEDLRRAIGRVQKLPVLPQVYRQVTAALQDPDVALRDVARIVEQDPAISLRLLQIVNSGFFGLSRKVARMEEAVTMVGLSMLRDLVLSAGVFRQLEQRKDLGLDLHRFQRHALLTARIARELAPFGAQDAFTAGMLHDLGKVVLPGKETPGVSHAEAGGYLLGLWGLPFPIVEAVACHHAPGRVAGGSFGLVGAVHVADVLAHELSGPGPEGTDDVPELDQAFLAATRVAEKLPEWRRTGARVAQQGGEPVRAR